MSHSILVIMGEFSLIQFIQTAQICLFPLLSVLLILSHNRLKADFSSTDKVYIQWLSKTTLLTIWLTSYNS